MTNRHRVHRCAATLAALIAVGCGSGSADPSDVPVYESSTVFNVEGPGSVDGPGIGNGEDHPSNNPVYSGAIRSAAVVGKRLVAFPGADYSAPLPVRAERGVLVYALEGGEGAEASEPIAELPLAGNALQMVAGADYVTMAARVPRQVEAEEIPTAALTDDAALLLRVDLSNPSEPRLSDGLELEGTFWQLVERDGYVFVLSQIPRAAASEDCLSYETSSAATTETMRVSSYRFDGSRYELVDARDLPGDGYAAFGTESGFVSVLGNYEANPTLSVATFSSDGQIRVSEPVAIAGAVTAADLTGTSLLVATLDQDVAQLARFDVDASALVEQWSQPLPRAASRLTQAELASEPVILGADWILRQDGTQVPLPAAVTPYHLLAASADSVLAAERDAAGKVSLSLLEVEAPFSLTRTSQLATTWPALEADGSGPGPFAWESTTQTLYYSFSVSDAQTSASASHVGLAGLRAGSLVALGDVSLAGRFGQPLVDAQGGYFVGSDGAQSVSAGPGPSAGTYLPFFGAAVPRVVDRRATDVGEFVLVQRGQGVFLQYPASVDGARREEQLPHFASELVAFGGTIAAMGVYWNQDCGRDLDAPELELTCPAPRQRGITLVTLSQPPGDPRTLPIDDAAGAPALPEGSEQTTTWFGYVKDGERLLFPVTRLIRCNTVAACEALGFPWYTGLATPGCNPQVEDCETKSNEPVQLVQGSGHESLLYVVSPATASALGEPMAFSEGVNFEQTLMLPQHESGGALDLSAMILQAGKVLGFPTDAPVYNAEGNSVTNQHGEALHRFGVELVRASRDDVTLQASVNTPGRVVALAEDGGVLYSVAPSHLDADHITALLHRLKVRPQGATIERSLDLGAGFRDAFRSGPSIHFLFGPEPACYRATPERESEFFSVDIESFMRGASLTLPWEGWSFDRAGAPASAAYAVLSGGPAGYRGRAELDLSGAEPEVARYYTVAP